LAEVSKWLAMKGRRVVHALRAKPDKAFNPLTTMQFFTMLLTYVFLCYV
jgi:hypothetical protein